jgi:DNA-binding GntR family transcriptional regulator
LETKRRKTSDYIYAEIKRRIIELEYEPNEHLSEEFLAKAFDVSRTPLREALYRLGMERLVVKQSTGRIVVTRLTISEAEEIYQVREVLEGLVAREAALKMTPVLLTRLEETMHLMEAAADSSRYTDVIRYGSEFHQVLYEPSGNETAIHFLDQLRSRIERYRRIGGYKHPDYTAKFPVDEHRHILSLIQNKDADGTEQAMRMHIRRSLGTVKDTLQMYFFK